MRTCSQRYLDGVICFYPQLEYLVALACETLNELSQLSQSLTISNWPSTVGCQKIPGQLVASLSPSRNPSPSRNLSWLQRRLELRLSSIVYIAYLLYN